MGHRRRRDLLYGLSVLYGTAVLSSWHRWKNLLFGLAPSLVRHLGCHTALMLPQHSIPVETSQLQVESYIQCNHIIVLLELKDILD